MTRNSTGILSEIARKSQKSCKITEITQKIHGTRTEFTRNSLGIP